MFATQNPSLIDDSRIGAGPAYAQNLLSRREVEVLAEMALGRRAAEIGTRLYISPHTVRSHVRNAMAKTGARTQAHLVAIALLAGILDEELLDSLAPRLQERPNRGR